MILIGWLRRGSVLGLKTDECPSCGRIGPHLIVRITTWFTIYRIPLVLLWVRHRLVCSSCQAESGLSLRQVWQATRRHRLSLQRPRPNYTVLRLEEANGLPSDPAALFDPVVPNRERTWFDRYTVAWPPVVALLVGFAVVNPFGLASAAGRAVSPSTSTAAWDSLAVGACFDDPAQAGATMAPFPSGATTDRPITIVPCTRPHQYEVFAVAQDDSPASAGYPGDTEVARQADTRCSAEFGLYVGVSIDASPLQVAYAVPTREKWASGQRTYTCLLYDRSNPKTVGSVKGSWTGWTASWDQRVTISHPASWATRAGPQPFSVAFTSADGEVDLAEIDGPDVSTAAEVLDYAVATQARDGARVVDSFDVTGTTDWRVLAYEWPDGRRGMEAAALTDGVGLVETLVPAPGHFDAALATFESMVQSAAVTQ